MTFIPYPDITATSPARKYRVEVRGTRAEGDFFRDQSGFTYRLFDTVTGREIWRWKPAEQHGLADYPQDAWVNDEGWVVARLHEWFHAGILVLSPCGELRVLRVIESFGEGESGLLDDEPDFHIGGGSAGPSWEVSSIALFHQYDGRAYWSILTWWRRRIVIDLENAAVLDDVPASQESLVEGLERAWMLSQLQRAAGELQSSEERGSCWWYSVALPSYTAAYHAGVVGVADASPFLRELETSPVSGYTSSHSWIGIAFLPFRLIAKISLLRLGIEPQWIANFVLTNQLTEARCTYPECPEVRRPEIIQRGVSQRELIRRLGVPEFISDEWDYCFFDGVHAFVLRVHWRDKHRRISNFDEYRVAVDREPPVVDRVERIDRPPWSVDSVREYSIAHGH